VLDVWPNVERQFEQSLPLLSLKPDALLGNPFAEHFVLRFQEFNLPDELVPSAAGQEEQQRLDKRTSHPMAVYSIEFC
jgi:hypothetical protein